MVLKGPEKYHKIPCTLLVFVIHAWMQFVLLSSTADTHAHVHVSIYAYESQSIKVLQKNIQWLKTYTVLGTSMEKL